MRCGVIARKLGMSRVFNDKGEHVPVTVLRLEDVEVLSTRSIKKDGYVAVQLGFNNKKLKNFTKPLKGFLENPSRCYDESAPLNSGAESDNIY